MQLALLELIAIKTMEDVIEAVESQSKGHEMVMLIIESSSKIHKPKSHEKVVNNPVHGR